MFFCFFLKFARNIYLFIPVSSRLGSTIVLSALQQACTLTQTSDLYCSDNAAHLVIRVTVPLPLLTQESPLWTAAAGRCKSSFIKLLGVFKHGAAHS